MKYIAINLTICAVGAAIICFAMYYALTAELCRYYGDYTDAQRAEMKLTAEECYR